MLGALANGLDLRLGEREAPVACCIHVGGKGVGRCTHTHRHRAANFSGTAEGDVGIGFAKVDDVVGCNRGDGGLRWRSGIKGQDGTCANHAVASHIGDVERDGDTAIGQASQIGGGAAIGVNGDCVACARDVGEDQGSSGIGIQTGHGVRQARLGAGVELAQGHANRSGVARVGLCVEREGNSLARRDVARLVDLAHQQVVGTLLGGERVGPGRTVVNAVLDCCTVFFDDGQGCVFGNTVSIYS